MVPADILQKVLFIRYKKNNEYVYGTSFTIDVVDKQYLISVKHIFEDVNSNSIIDLELYQNKTWKKLIDLKPIICSNLKLDLIAFKLNNDITPKYNNVLNMAGLKISQDIYFLGFPLATSVDASKLNNGYPFAYVKKGIISAIDCEDLNNIIIYLDGYNCDGFSGGPVVYYNDITKELHVVGIITGYIYNPNNIEEIENIGIFTATPIKYILEVINKKI